MDDLETSPVRAVRYQNSPADFWHFWYFESRRSRGLKVVWGVGVLLLVGLFWAARPQGLVSAWASVTTCLVLSAVGVTAYTVGLALLMAARLRFGYRWLFASEITVMARETSLVFEAAGERTDVPWTMVRRLVQTRRFLCLFLSGKTLLVLPRRAFWGALEWRSFAAFCREQIPPQNRVGVSEATLLKD